jgi:antitoxin component YwqK of YwqJK toxin-antitoxin module
VQIKRYDAGHVFQELQYLGGRLEGESREFAIDHKLTAIWNYHKGVKDGLQRGWFEEGPKRFEHNFRNGALDGEQLEWHMSGDLFKEQYYVDGVETDRKILFENGAVFSNYAKRDGRIYGIDGGSLCMQKKPEGEK